ncbi:hypothetical protein [Nocardioides bruguierae]|uniref:hypothetical protein n=1 Tax=Nocardioides bruguierae TaxID=2945102 RepID=UPI002020AD58|nr:hypothetical protein [Nocardioides bruguierae]MCL8023894.1 hypothetical protein [Nocardioides bruguierae]
MPSARFVLPAHRTSHRATRRATHRATLAFLGSAAAALGVLAPVSPVAVAPAAADETPYVVSVGDSYISGEAGRWAGSSNADSDRADALGAGAYLDAGSSESIERCHRSSSAEIHIGTAPSLNLACSGAETSTSTGDRFKPGLDFYEGSEGQGQALALQEFASTHDVGMVVVSIGGNDVGFADVVQTCVLDFLYSPGWAKDYCHDDNSVEQAFSASHLAQVRADVAAGLTNIATAMRTAGYSDDEWTLLLQTYPSPIPRAGGFRYSQSGYTRQDTGGCGFWNADADWANDTALPAINSTVLGGLADSGLTNTAVLDLAHTFDGRRLCESGVGLYEEVGLASWTSPGAVDRTEWVNQIRTVSTIGSSSPYYVQESLHPNYWGQLAVRSCVRQAWNGGTPVGGTCTRTGTGLTAGEPVMALR